ncbi:MAG: methylated-DNA--[protein]-cysteine S-methyltransferase [Rhizobiales bacterium]|nr:methylated-DNA--[protein]-cysteine S-methyltransferase [Hyphomicrobiales bacterium]
MTDLKTKVAELTKYNNEYDLVVKTIEFLTQNQYDQPKLFDVADHVGMTSGHVQKIFTKWAGVSPKDFQHYLTIAHARKMLAERETILNTSYDLGLSSPARLHDLFTKVEAMPPGVYKSGGQGIDIIYGYAETPFGRTLIMKTKQLIAGKLQYGVCGIGFVDESDADALEDMQKRWPKANYVLEEQTILQDAKTIFAPEKWAKEKPMTIILIGSDFDVQIWRTLLKIPMGKAVSYGDIALHLGKKKGASRAVGSAVGRNPISFLVPCHRVLRANGEMGGYHWGISRKRAIIGWEAQY